MRVIFRVPIHGSLLLLLIMCLPFLLTVLGLGLIRLPLGLHLPNRQHPPFFPAVSRFIPLTYYIRFLRGMVLRGGGSRRVIAKTPQFSDPHGSHYHPLRPRLIRVTKSLSLGARSVCRRTFGFAAVSALTFILDSFVFTRNSVSESSRNRGLVSRILQQAAGVPPR
jgi:hypothetical protein